jgi:hypothetical protein
LSTNIPGWQARGEAAVREQPTPAAVPEKNRLPTFQFEITAKMDPLSRIKNL